MPETFRDYVCWNTERLSTVINKEAVSVDRATFLATHTPLTNLTYDPPASDDTGEVGLLRELEQRAERDQHTFAVVQGEPGTGKSHLIRWLKEKYQASPEARNDEVLLIERASSSLRGTLEQLLQQIVASGTVDTAALQEQLERVRSATLQLSSAGLAESILNNLQVGVVAEKLPEGAEPPQRIAKRASAFLLDLTIREQFKRPGGPINRLVRFLQTGTGTRAGVEMPGFEASDFDFVEEILPTLSGQSNPEALHLAEDLVQRPQLRDDFARYLNRLKNFAVSQSTALSADDLKDMFFKLRRQLRRQGRNLALFIEDVTAFTGLDAGLIDVLATQHTGERNREFCRLLAVIGITNNYYAESFPTNIKERVTYRISLNDAWQGHSDPGQLGLFAGRYLNALRVTDQQLQTWAVQGAIEEHLPNPCVECRFKATCHRAFGAVVPGEGQRVGSEIGLYPFNTTALAAMYGGLQTQSRTPRALLNSVLQYVLHNHTMKIREGAFPPPAKQVGGEFRAPDLERLVQLQTIMNQAGDEWRRVESLVLFWGDRTIDATTDIAGTPYVGGLPEEVFGAFSLRPITGILAGTKVVQRTQPQGKAVEKDTLTQPLPPPQKNKYEREITEWLRGGRLNNVTDPRRYLSSYLRSAIPWELSGLPEVLVEEKLANPRLEIEDQSGKVVGEHVQFPRSEKLAAVLVALVNLHDAPESLSDSALGTHLATLGAWKRAEERRLAEYVSRAQGDRPADHLLLEILLYTCLVLDCLEGNLRPSAASGRELLARLLRATDTASRWQAAREKASDTHGSAWVKLMAQLTTHVQATRALLLRMLNLPQGGASSIKFIDAATALDSLGTFTRGDWTLTPIGEVKAALPMWEDAASAYSKVCSGFPRALEEDRTLLASRLEQLKTYLGDEDPKEVLAAYAQVLTDLDTNQQSYSLDRLEKKPTHAAKELNDAVESLQKILEVQTRGELALRLSAMTAHMGVIQQYNGRFAKFSKFAADRQRKLMEDIAKLTASGGGARARQQTDQLYAETEGVLDRACSALDVRAEVAG